MVLFALAFPVASSVSHAQNTNTDGILGKRADPINRRVVVRFVTESDYPPFNFYDEDGILAGFNVDVARAICQELDTACDIKVKPWDELFLALQRGEADAAISS
jgi:polar amino acid transport system substrate-binding protein